MATNNKVQFGLKNVHYAIQTVGTDSSITYSTPVKVSGAVSLTLDPNSQITPFYADNMVYHNSCANNGYTGSIELAKVSNAMLKDIWGFAEDTDDKVLVESATVEPKTFALLYQIDGDAGDECYVLYNCTATKPAVGSQTTTDTKEPKTQSCNLTAVALADGKILARTTADTPSTTKSAWFTSVWVG